MMSETQSQGGGALEPHPFGSGFGPPLSSGKDPYSPPSNSNGLTDLSSDSHLTLLKGSSSLGSFASFGDADGRLSDSFMEMRYIQLGDWDLAGYTAEGLTARLLDNRSLNDSPDNIIQYRPWEKPGSGLGATLGSLTGSAPSPGPQLIIASSANGMPNVVGTQGKSPTTLTTLTNAFPTFSDAFGPNGQKLPSFQSQFNSFNDPPLHQHTPLPPHNHQNTNGGGGHNGDMQPSPVPTTTTSSGPPSLPSFHTLPPNRGYTNHGHHAHQTLITAAPLQTRDLQQHTFLDERHIQIFPGQLITTTAPAQHQAVLTNGNGHHYVTTTNPMLMNGHGPHGNNFISGNSPPQHFLELVPVSPMQLHGHYAPPPPHVHPKPTDGNPPSLNLDLHHAHHNGNGLGLTPLNGQPPPPTKYHNSPGQGMDHHHHLHHQITRIDQAHNPQNSPQIVTNSNGGGRGKKPPKRKRNSVEGLDPSGYNNNGSHPNPYAQNNISSHDLSSEPQVSSVSSTDSDFKRPNLGPGLDHQGHLHHIGSGEQNTLEKASKKKRKRCGECTGCSRKDNCADCAPCRNEKSHQICKQRRCEKLTEKKSRAGRVAGAALMK